MLAAPIARPWWLHRVYLGQISPNVWHNPTSLLCWPLVILLFFSAADFLQTARWRSLVAVAALAAVSVLAKPNYFLAFAPVFGLLGLRRFGISRLWLASQAAMLPTVGILCWQLLASFNGPDAMRPGLTIALHPLAAWQMYTDSVLISLLVSLAFPLSYLVIFRRSLGNPRLLTFAWCVTASALLWTLCFAEVRTSDGLVDPDFNFSWGSHLSLFVLFLVTAIDMVNNPAAMAAIGRVPTTVRYARIPWWLLGAARGQRSAVVDSPGRWPRVLLGATAWCRWHTEAGAAINRRAFALLALFAGANFPDGKVALIRKFDAVSRDRQ